MDLKEKLALLEETLEMDEGTLSEDAVLADLDEYNSMARLALIVMMEDECGKTLSGETLRGFTTVKDIMDYMD